MPEQDCDNRSFWDHLEELRRCLIVMILGWLAGVLVCFPFSEAVIRHISRPVGQLVFLSPAEAFSVRITIAFFLGALFALPVWLYQIAAFLKDGLKKTEQTILIRGCLLIVVMSLLGVLFADLVLVPVSVKFLLGFSGPSLQPMISAAHYTGFYAGIMAACCLVFNLPFVIIGLAWSGLVPARWFAVYRRHMYIACIIFGAVMTPPDIVTQVMIAFPLCALYELSLWGAVLVSRRKKE